MHNSILGEFRVSVAIRQLDEQVTLTNKQRLVMSLAGIHGMLEFFDQYIIAFVVAFVIRPWHMTYGESAIVLLSSGIGSIAGSFLWGYVGDRFGRRTALIAIIVSYSISSLFLAFTPEGNWIYFTIFRLGVGLGVGGWVVNVAFVQEFMPTQKRGWASGFISICVPTGLLVSSACAAFLTPIIGWRGLFVLAALPALFVFVIVAFVPESPRWALSHGRVDLARKSAGWALGIPPASVKIELTEGVELAPPKFTEIFAYPRSVVTSFLVSIGVITGIYGLILWSPTLLVMVQGVSPEIASKLMVAISLANILGRILFSHLSEMVGRRASGAISCFGGAILLSFTGWVARDAMGLGPYFFMFLLASYFVLDGGSAISTPYTTEIWPSRLRTSGSGFGYGSGSIGKITGPLGLALVIGSSNYIKPEVTIPAIVPAFLYLAGWYVLAGIAYTFIGIETKGRSLEQIDMALEATVVRTAPGAALNQVLPPD